MTPEALAVIRNSLHVAQADPAELGVRLRIAGGEVRPQFVAEPREDDEVTEVEGLRVFIARAIVEDLGDVVVDATAEHGNLIVRSL